MNNQDLEQLFAEFDAQVALNIRTNGARWSAEALAAACEKQGLIRCVNGSWIMPDHTGGALFTLSTAPARPDPSSFVSLVTNLPCVPRDSNAFGSMAACARDLALQLDGTIVDDGNSQLTHAALAQIATQVTAFYEHMEKSGLAPGSVLAKRLFGHGDGMTSQAKRAF